MERLELCGIYYRKNPTGKKWENICLSDLEDNDIIEIMEKQTPEFVDNVLKRFAEVYTEMITLVVNTYESEESKKQKTLNVLQFNKLMREFAKTYGITKHAEEENE